jgi:hypothetical protein
MEVAIEFNKSAFRHGVSREDIVHAIKTRVHAAMMSRFPEKYAIIGFDTKGNPLEVMYNPIDDDTINIFHAMKARKSFIEQLGL